MKIATWNVNSIRARAERIRGWVERVKPDVLCMQEIKVEDAGFPGDEYRSLGYHVETHGQKTYNGVALLSLGGGMTDVKRGFGDGGDESQSRFIAATVRGVKVASVYVPNGQEPGSEKYAYKLAWMSRLGTWAKSWLAGGAVGALCGDFNVAPTDQDVHFPEKWAGKIHVSAAERAAFAAIVETAGLVDVVRQLRPTEEILTWWDYRMLAFPKNNGLRIDHVLGTRSFAAKAKAVEVHRDERKGAQPSDHVPVVVEVG